MQFKLQGPWPVGQHLLVDGTLIDFTTKDWKGDLLPQPFPPNALPQDAEAKALYATWWPWGMRPPGL